MGVAAIYARVSTKVQAEEGTSLGSQMAASLHQAESDGYQVPQHLRLEEDWTGATLERPKLDRVREWVRRREIAALVVYSTDRLARNPVHLAIVAEECQKRGVQLLFLTEPLDYSPEGQLIAYVRGFAAQVEREKIRERTLRGKIQAIRLPGGRIRIEEAEVGMWSLLARGAPSFRVARRRAKDVERLCWEGQR